VLAGVSVEDRDLWNLVRAIQEVELRCFGRRYRSQERELKSVKLLTTSVFKHAGWEEPIPPDKRTMLAKACLDDGPSATRLHMAALAQAKLAFVGEVLDLCAQYRCRAFGSIVLEPPAERLPPQLLRKDYVYLLERFFYFLEDQDATSQGIVVFDELDKAQCTVLIDQMANYFKVFWKGRQRAARVIPEPLFVHSDLTTGILLADLVAYLISWGFRRIEMLTKPRRDELDDLVERICRLRYRTERDFDDWPHQHQQIWSFTAIPSLLGALQEV